MRADNLDHEELLELDPEGRHPLRRQRALLLGAVAMGLPRKYLVENFGLTLQACCSVWPVIRR